LNWRASPSCRDFHVLANLRKSVDSDKRGRVGLVLVFEPYGSPELNIVIAFADVRKLGVDLTTSQQIIVDA
jgi:hypothetical protein